MLTRLYIDNFRCFEDFEYKPGPKQLILGANGTGKSSLMDAVMRLQRFVTTPATVGGVFRAADRTRWSKKTGMKFGLDCVVDNQRYAYEVVVEISPPEPKVVSETLSRNGARILRSDGEWVTFSPSGLNPNGTEGAGRYPAVPRRSALENFPSEVLDPDRYVQTFREWLSSLQFFKINPFRMESETKEEVKRPRRSLTNFASWYRHAVSANPESNERFLSDLRESIDGFETLSLVDAGAGVRLLLVEFRRGDVSTVNYRFGELSEGQRCLVCLYAILHFVVGAGLTAFIDEPENFIGLREMQPWLIGLTDAVEDHAGQAILISHHPEFLDQWAPPFGLRFVRVGAGPARIKGLENHSPTLTVSELVALGWDDD